MEKNEHFIQVCNYFFTGKQQVPAGEQPRLIFVFGSPGAGKSTNIKPLLLKSFQTSPACLEVDELKAFLPEGEERNPQMADEWFNRIVDEAVKLRYNLVIFACAICCCRGRRRGFCAMPGNTAIKRKWTFLRLTAAAARWE